jgi:hypothetical protein
MDIKQELAKKLHGRQYLEEITKEEENYAKENNLVVVFGASDDNMEFRGIIYDEINCYDGGTAYLDKHGLLVNECDDDYCPHFIRIKEQATQIKAVWDEEGYSWIYKTDIPHVTFDILNEDYEDGMKYCKGIIFSMDDVD